MLDGALTPASGASGNPAGLFHGVVHPADGGHDRLPRAPARRFWLPWSLFFVVAGLLPHSVPTRLVVPNPLPRPFHARQAWRFLPRFVR